MSLFIPITKVDAARRLVYGTVTEEVPDKAGEILDYDSARPAFEEWSEACQQASGGKSLGNVRAMHGSVAAGKLTDISFDDAHKRIEGVAKIVDDDAWQKVMEGVYTGFSIGGGYARRWPDSNNPELMRYTPTLTEVSLVDNPAVPTATFQLIKSDGSIESRSFTLTKEKPVMQNNAVKNSFENDPLNELLNGLDWLEDQVSEEGDEELLDHIHAVQDYLSDADAEQDEDNDNDSDEEEIEDNDNEEEDTTSQAYASELARISRRAVITDAHKKTHKTQINNQLRSFQRHIQTLQKRVAQLEAQPLPAKGALRVINKSDNFSSESSLPTNKHSPNNIKELMKIALSQPVEL